MHRITYALIAALALSAGTAYADAAQDTWDKKCASCHGKDGKGETKQGQKLKVQDLTDPAVQAKFKDDEIAKAITDGIEEKKMPAFKAKLSADEIAALAKVTRSFQKK